MTQARGKESQRDYKDIPPMPFFKRFALTTGNSVLVNNSFVLGCNNDNRRKSRIVVMADLKTAVRLEGEEAKEMLNEDGIGSKSYGSGKNADIIYVGNDYVITRVHASRNPSSHVITESLLLESTKEIKIAPILFGAKPREVLEKALKRAG